MKVVTDNYRQMCNTSYNLTWHELNTQMLND